MAKARDDRGRSGARAGASARFAVVKYREGEAATRAEERLMQAYLQNLSRLGIAARLRLSDSAQRDPA